MEIEGLLARINVAFDDAHQMRDQFLSNAQASQAKGDLARGLADQIAASSHAAVLRTLAILLERDIPPTPDASGSASAPSGS